MNGVADTPPSLESISTLVEEGAFEETLSALELVVEHLERGRLTMDESIAWYEAGLGLMRRCSHLLEQAELRISALDAENPAHSRNDHRLVNERCLGHRWLVARAGVPASSAACERRRDRESRSHARAASRWQAAWLALAKSASRSPRDPDILVGPGLGRDAAAIAVGERVIVAKNDPITFASEGGAAHLVEVNANDVACMGATPRWLLVTALLPHGVTPADVLNQFAELRETCRHRSVELIGGHTEIVPGLARPILVGMMLGDASPHELLRPGQAQPGDVLLVTKGLAIEGTALLARERADELRERIGDESSARRGTADGPTRNLRRGRGRDCPPLRQGHRAARSN